MAAPRAPTLTLIVPAPLEREDLPALLERTCALLAGAGEVRLLRCEVGGVAADAVAVDALARLALAAHRSSCDVLLCGASSRLLELVAFLGLADVLRAEEAGG